jgi:zinc protease
MKRMQSVAYDWHSYGRSTIGNKQRHRERQASRTCRLLPHLLPAGQRRAAGGRQVRPLADAGTISKLFGAIPKPKRTLPEFWTVEPTQDGERSFVVRRQGDVQIVALGYKVPSACTTTATC